MENDPNNTVSTIWTAVKYTTTSEAWGGIVKIFACMNFVLITLHRVTYTYPKMSKAFRNALCLQPVPKSQLYIIREVVTKYDYFYTKMVYQPTYRL